MIEDPVTFEVIKNALISCAREMSLALRLTAFSPNIKERRDCSCALFDAEGRLIAQSKDLVARFVIKDARSVNEFRDEQSSNKSPGM